MSNRYREIRAADVPADIRWDVPGHNQGQIVEVAYADYPTERVEACAGSTYKRITDRSERLGSPKRVTYYRKGEQ